VICCGFDLADAQLFSLLLFIGVILNRLVLAILSDLVSTERQGRLLSSFTLVKNFRLDTFLVKIFYQAVVILESDLEAAKWKVRGEQSRSNVHCKASEKLTE
jgi:hypothetical protein